MPSLCYLWVSFVQKLLVPAIFSGNLTIHTFYDFNRQKCWNSMKKIEYILTRFEMWIHNYPSPIVVKIPLHAAHVEIPFDNEYVGSNLVFRFCAHICHRFSVNPGPSNPVWEQSQLCHYLSDFLGTTHVVFTRFVTDSLCSHFSIFFSCLSWDGSPLLLSARSHFSTRLIIIEGWTPNRLVPQIRDFWN